MHALDGWTDRIVIAKPHVDAVKICDSAYFYCDFITALIVLVSANTAGTGMVFLVTGKPSNSIFINELIQFLSLELCVNCAFRVISVSFIIWHFCLSHVG